MKHRCTLIPLLFSIPLLMSSLVGTQISKANASGGSYEQSSLPTTIKLNDYSDNSIREYYSDLDSLSEKERQGDNLLKNLKPILSNNQKYYSYDSGSGKSNSIWKIYEIADRDWSKSPKEDIAGYDSITNTITNYKYGDTNPYVRALYVDRSIDNPKTAWGNHTERGNNECIEREHIWPKSHGFDENKEGSDNSGARGDPMHLWAADGGTNGIHSNFFYGNVNTLKKHTKSQDNYKWTGENLLGFSETDKKSTATVFEPQDSDKGDIARACFYMVARYNNIAGNDSMIDSTNPNLCLSDDASKSSETGTSTKTVSYALGIMSDLLEWNKLDPVDSYELHRNNLLYGNFTNNRNPFIDFPEWADIIWGEDKTSKAATPSTDEIARPKDFVPPEDDTLFGIPAVYVYIAAAVIVVLVIIIVVVVMTKGSKKQKKTLKKVASKAVKKVTKSTTSNKKKTK